MTEKKRFEKAISQLDSAFQKAKEVKSTTVDVSAEDKNLSKELNATRKTTLDNLFDKQKSELKLEIPSKNRFQKTNPNALISEVDILKKQPDLEIKKVPYLKKTFQRLQNLRETSKETDKKETVPFDNSFDSAIEKLARKKQRVPDTKTAGIKPIELKESQKTEPKKEVKILPHEPIDDKKKWQQNLEDSLYLALHKILTSFFGSVFCDSFNSIGFIPAVFVSGTRCFFLANFSIAESKLLSKGTVSFLSVSLLVSLRFCNL